MIRSSLLHPALRAIAVAAFFALAAIAACLAVPGVAHAQQAAQQLANPASRNCVARGGRLVIEKNPRGGQYGVCVFEDNLQCEEWALLRGECRAGGIKVTGYATPAARYCAISGGSYTVTAASNTPAERGDCSFPNGSRCTAAAFYDGACSRRSGATAAGAAGADAGALKPAPQRIRARFACADGKAIDSTFINANDGGINRVQLAFSDGRRMNLPQVISADGGRYANKAETIVFWNKGRTAFVQENGKTTYADCATK